MYENIDIIKDIYETTKKIILIDKEFAINTDKHYEKYSKKVLNE